jgi:hypothetical protein
MFIYISLFQNLGKRAMEWDFHKGFYLSNTFDTRHPKDNAKTTTTPYWVYQKLHGCMTRCMCMYVHLPLYLSQPYFGQVWGWSPTLGKSWDWSPPGLPKTQKTIWKTKTPRIGMFLVSLEMSWNVDIENALAFSIWTSAAQVMGKRRAGSQIGSLTPDH